ncbi:hypothetical protein ACOSP7_016554 [Xanthoceras sorbifolium]|uniref:Uncharacterized protein n=1 Tax=Xanthoceras sorbifolium TaxID=99658 RepID=A0ABQ8HIQ9_9ROSI|nr:hypothetical protein JRO89_XS10G0145600 [Xanthoceras sorbifolium]
MEDSSYLPLYSRRPGARQTRSRGTPISHPRSSSSPAPKYVHVIPVILLLTFFILWWFSYPVNLVIKDGRIVEIVTTDEMIPALDDTRVELAILASSAVSPIGLISPDLNLTTGNNETGISLF